MTKLGMEVLRTLDRAKTQGYHFRSIVIAGMGFFTDAYDIFSVSTVTKLLGRIYYYDPATNKPGILPPGVAAAVNGVVLVGTLVGQLFFGWAGDKFGRKKVYGITLIIMIIMSLASGLSLGSTAKSTITSLCFFRFWLGFGVGGDYPLSATIMSEYSNTKTRGAFIAAVFAMQGFGILTGATVAIILSASFKAAYSRPSFNVDHIHSTPPEADFVWRILFMFGAIPAACTYYYRIRMPETARYTALVEKNTNQAVRDMESVLQIQFEKGDEIADKDEKKLAAAERAAAAKVQYGLYSREFLKRHGIHLLGTSTCWFLLDVAYFSQNLFQKDIFTAVGWIPAAGRMSALEEMFKIGRAQALIALFSTIPGYWVTVATIDKIGRWWIQLIGFFFMTLFMFILTLDYYKLRGDPCFDDKSKYCGGNHFGFIAMYALTFFFANFGPNSTTFIVPAELFPARLRSTCHGISAASGKAGAIIGALGFLWASQNSHQGKQDHGYPTGIGIKKSLLLLAICNGVGFFFTFLVPETKGKSLEELSGEAEEENNAKSLLQTATE